MSLSHEIFHEGEFRVQSLSNNFISLKMVPELGGRIVSLFDQISDREWLDGWQPESKRRLWRPTDPTDYNTSSGAGIDECFPTVLPCTVGNDEIPDHGELWSTEPIFSRREENLHCLWRLTCLPLTFERSVTLIENKVVLSYRIENLSQATIPFLWAWHPLFKIEEGDRLEVNPAITQCQNPEGEILHWPSPLPSQDLMKAEVGDVLPPCSKTFVGPFDEGKARLRGSNCSLEVRWPARLFPWAGIWISRGAWKGLHHWAVEPTNSPVDWLSSVPSNSLASLTGRETREWNITLILLPISA